MDVGGSLTSGSQKSAVAFSLIFLILCVPDGLSTFVSDTAYVTMWCGILMQAEALLQPA